MSDSDRNGENAGGNGGGNAGENLGDAPFVNDFIVEDAVKKETVTNDAVAGETVLPGAGDGNNGPTGGSPREGEPIYDVNEQDTDPDISLGDRE
ncbi:MAG: hypothetical protein JWQ59_89 [Cryobacterium sp.]|jgi:hypothetical protein|nr:hypothetical protein [Cryobacterium sp.]